MGRPLKKKYFGSLGVDATPHIPVRFKTGGTVYEGYIVKQKGSRRFKCSDGTHTATCLIVDGTSTQFDPANNGEMTIVGYTATGGATRSIRRMTNHIAWDYLGYMHKWSLQDDSTKDLIILTRP